MSKNIFIIISLKMNCVSLVKDKTKFLNVLVHIQYRMSLLLVDLGWVDFDLDVA